MAARSPLRGPLFQARIRAKPRPRIVRAESRSTRTPLPGLPLREENHVDMPEDDRSAARGPDIIAPPPLLFAGPWLVGFLLDLVVQLPRLPGVLRLVGVPLTAAGVALLVWFFVTMQRAGTPVDPRERPTTLVQAGPFRLTRNPAYVGWTVFYLGLTLLAGGRWALVLLPGVLVAMDVGVIRREERYLEKQFGADYRDYRRRVRRWL